MCRCSGLALCYAVLEIVGIIIVIIIIIILVAAAAAVVICHVCRMPP